MGWSARPQRVVLTPSLQTRRPVARYVTKEDEDSSGESPAALLRFLTLRDAA